MGVFGVCVDVHYGFEFSVTVVVGDAGPVCVPEHELAVVTV